MESTSAKTQSSTAGASEFSRISLDLLEQLVRAIPEGARELIARLAEAAQDPELRAQVAAHIASAAADRGGARSLRK